MGVRVGGELGEEGVVEGEEGGDGDEEGVEEEASFDADFEGVVEGPPGMKIELKLFVDSGMPGL